MKLQKRISSEERREKIIEAATRVFAEKGFHGTTTRELALAASVSEALIFKHFPTKEAIYSAMLSSCQKSEMGGEIRKLLDLQPSTSTLAVMLHFLIAKLVIGNEHARDIHHLILRSLSEDGAFARVIFKHIGETWIAKMNDCLKAAEAAGDLRLSADKLKSSAWLTQHLLIMISFIHVPDESVVGYKVPVKRLTEEAVVFCLRGMGLKDEAVSKFYNPSAFALLTEVQ